MQFLMVQRSDGGLTIGATHGYERPLALDTVEDPYGHLIQVVESLLGRPLPRIRRRWAIVYARCPTRIGPSIVSRCTRPPGWSTAPAAVA